MSYLAFYNEKLFQRSATSVADKLDLTFSLLIETYRDVEDAHFKGTLDEVNYNKALNSLKELWEKLLMLQIYYESSMENYSLLSSAFTVAIMELRRDIARMRAKAQLDNINELAWGFDFV
ncbi:hypothetical protein DRP05_11695 [Archaeoglobales archaeon]|nr:MAG: hypothetical protein DRP05_11695 [Archaeoglobales archaeon]